MFGSICSQDNCKISNEWMSMLREENSWISQRPHEIFKLFQLRKDRPINLPENTFHLKDFFSPHSWKSVTEKQKQKKTTSKLKPRAFASHMLSDIDLIHFHFLKAKNERERLFDMVCSGVVLCCVRNGVFKMNIWCRLTYYNKYITHTLMHRHTHTGSMPKQSNR